MKSKVAGFYTARTANMAALPWPNFAPPFSVSFGGITFRRYRGGLGFGVPTDKAYFYPEGVEGLFEIYYAPADTFETVNTVGLPLYARMIPDRDRDEWVRLEIESNPLPICTRPQVLRSARRT